MLAEEIQNELCRRRAFEDNPVTENMLARMFGVSRTPVREALKRLEQDRILERKHKKGIYLRVPSVTEIGEIFDVRCALEGLAVRVAVEKITPEDIEYLVNKCKTVDQSFSENNYVAMETADIAFHKKILLVSENAVLIRMVDTLNILNQSFMYNQSVHKIMPLSSANPYTHEMIIDCIRKKDIDASERTIKNHIQWGKQWLMEKIVNIKIHHF